MRVRGWNMLVGHFLQCGVKDWTEERAAGPEGREEESPTPPPPQTVNCRNPLLLFSQDIWIYFSVHPVWRVCTSFTEHWGCRWCRFEMSVGSQSFQRLGSSQTSFIEPFYVEFFVLFVVVGYFFFSFKSSPQLLQLFRTMLQVFFFFCRDAPEIFCGLQNFTQLSIGRGSEHDKFTFILAWPAKL